jgi:hypothetical protein
MIGPVSLAPSPACFARETFAWPFECFACETFALPVLAFREIAHGKT